MVDPLLHYHPGTLQVQMVFMLESLISNSRKSSPHCYLLYKSLHLTFDAPSNTCVAALSNLICCRDFTIDGST